MSTRRERRSAVRARRRMLEFSLCCLMACTSGEARDGDSVRDAGTDEGSDADTADDPERNDDDDDEEVLDSGSDDAFDAALSLTLDAALDASLDSALDSAIDAGHDAGLDLAALFGCMNRKNNIPDTLECTGLYFNLETKQVASDVREFRPAVTLWSNGADKQRWIYLPPGTTIDASDAREWVFPVGTKLWKEFRIGGRRVETRFLNKIAANNWLRGAYRWADDERSAVRYDSSSTEIFQTADGTQYHIPTPVQCDDCHNGRRDFVMGFESILLGLEGAGGVTLELLANEGLLSPKPSVTHYGFGTLDAKDNEARALSWLHVNCGVSCHNANPKAKGASFDLRLRLDPEQLAAGSAPDGTWDVLKSTVNVPGKSKTGSGSMRVLPSQPDASLLVKLISGSPAMPYLDTVQVNEADLPAIEFVRAWIASMPPDASDGGVDAGNPDAGSEFDAGARDGGRPAFDAGRANGDASVNNDASDNDASDAQAAADAAQSDADASDD